MSSFFILVFFILAFLVLFSFWFAFWTWDYLAGEFKGYPMLTHYLLAKSLKGSNDYEAYDTFERVDPDGLPWTADSWSRSVLSEYSSTDKKRGTVKWVASIKKETGSERWWFNPELNCWTQDGIIVPAPTGTIIPIYDNISLCRDLALIGNLL